MPLYGPASSPATVTSALPAGAAIRVAERLDGSVVILWTDSSGDIYGKIVAANGTVLVPDFLVPTTATGFQNVPGVAARASDGAFLTVWRSAVSGDPVTIQAQLFDASGNRVGSEFTISAASPDRIIIAPLADGGFMVIWELASDEIRAQRLDASGAEVGSEIILFTAPANPIDYNLGEAFQLPSGELVVTVHAPRYTGGPAEYSFLRTFDLAGNPTSDSQAFGIGDEPPELAVAADGSFFALTDASGATVEIQRFDADAVKVGAPITINVGGNSANGVDIVALPDGGFLLSWTGTALAGSGSAIFAQTFDAAGVRTGPLVELAVDAGAAPVLVDITREDDGSFQLTWWVGSTLLTQRFEEQDYPASGTFTGTGANDNLIGGEGNDVINALGGNDRLFGWTGNDRLDGGTGTDVTDGGAGDDLHYVDSQSDIVIELAGEGSDYLLSSVNYVLGAGVHVELMSTLSNSGTAAINLTGNAFAQAIVGNAGANKLIGGGGADILVGLGGDDFLVVDADDVVVEAVGGGFDNVAALVSYTLGAGVEAEVLSTNDNVGNEAINLTGNEFGQAIVGNRADNILRGGGGVDVLVGLEGSDTLFVDADDIVVEATGVFGVDYVVASTSYVLTAGASVEILSTTNNDGTAAINLTGNEFGQLIVGNAGNNYLDGGGEGNDRLVGLGGNDTYIVGGDEVIIEGVGGGFDNLAAKASYTLAVGVEIEVLSTTDNGGTAAINLNGNEFSQVIVGNAGTNYLDGGGGADTLVGLGGNDTLIVDANDVVVEAVGGGSDTVAAKTSYVLNAGAEIESLTTTDSGGTTAINLTGNEFGQALVGNEGVNTLDGKGGNDVLVGLGGADVYAFTSALGANNVDSIIGFTVSSDKIALDDAVFAGLAPGALDPTAFVTGTAAQDANDRIIYNQATGQLFYDADGSGAGAQILFATLQGTPLITAGDFTVI